MSILLEPFRPAPPLRLFGAGHVARAVATAASLAGFAVEVVDDRPEWADPNRFPGATLRVLDPLEAWADLDWGPDLSVLILTHSHRLDEELLRRALDEEWAYLGVIGSRAKARRFQQRLLARGVARDRLARVHMPIGLGLGDKTPGQIAIAVVAELLLERGGGDPSSRSMPLPPPEETSQEEDQRGPADGS